MDAQQEMPVSGTQHPGAPVAQLAKGRLSQAEVIFQAVTHLGPAVGIIIVGPVLVGFVGASVPLLLVASMLAITLTGLCVSALAKHLPSAGGYYSFVSNGLGERIGFFAAWAYFLYDPLIPTLVILISAGILDQVFKANLGWTVPWWAITLVLLTIVHFITYWGVKPSTRLNLLLGVIEMVIMVALALSIIIHSGSQGLSLVPFQFPDISQGWQNVFLGLAFGVLLFTGFESAAPLAEETANPRKAIPRTVRHDCWLGYCQCRWYCHSQREPFLLPGTPGVGMGLDHRCICSGQLVFSVCTRGSKCRRSRSLRARSRSYFAHGIWLCTSKTPDTLGRLNVPDASQCGGIALARFLARSHRRVWLHRPSHHAGTHCRLRARQYCSYPSLLETCAPGMESDPARCRTHRWHIDPGILLLLLDLALTHMASIAICLARCLLAHYRSDPRWIFMADSPKGASRGCHRSLRRWPEK